MKNLLCAATLLFSSFAASSAIAQPNPTPLDDINLVPAPVMIATPNYSCDATGNPALNPAQAQFDTGFRASYLLTWQAWAGSGMNRNDVTNFISQATAIATGNINNGLANLDPLNNSMHNTPGCRFWGSLSGVTKAVDDILTSVVLSCGTEGTYFATYTAPIYCDLASLFGPLAAAPLLPRTPGTCSTAFEPACEGAFDSMTTAMCPALVPDATAPATLVYQPGFDSSRHNNCTF